MTKEELREHCEKQVKMCKEWAKGNDREPSGMIYEEHKLILDLINELQDKSYELWKESYEEEHRRNIRLEEEIKALEQQPSEDKVSMEVYKQVTAERDIAIEQLRELGYEFGEKIRTSDNCVSRQAVKEGMIKYGFRAPDMTVTEFIEDELPPVTPTFPKDATNRDIIKVMFPKAWGSNYIDSSNKFTLYIDNDYELEVDADWWNAPYKRGSEDE